MVLFKKDFFKTYHVKTCSYFFSQVKIYTELWGTASCAEEYILKRYFYRMGDSYPFYCFIFDRKSGREFNDIVIKQ